MDLWFMLRIYCVVNQEDDEFIARIPDVDDLEGVGDSANAAVKDLSDKAFYMLRMG